MLSLKKRIAEISIRSISTQWLLGSTADIWEKVVPVWEVTRASFIVPVLKVALTTCLVMSFLLFLEWVHMMLLAAIAKVFLKKPEKRYKFEPLMDDLETGNEILPMVLVQIPLFNEIEVIFLILF